MKLQIKLQKEEKLFELRKAENKAEIDLIPDGHSF